MLIGGSFFYGGILEDFASSLSKTVIDTIRKRMIKAVSANITSVANKIGSMSEDIYNVFIEEFYSQYKPRFYDRWYGLRGIQNIDIISNGRGDPYINFSIDGNKMIGEYEEDKDIIVDIVMSGLRGVPKKWIIPWNVKYFGMFSYEGDSMKDAFDSFFDSFAKEYAINQFSVIFKSLF